MGLKPTLTGLKPHTARDTGSQDLLGVNVDGFLLMDNLKFNVPSTVFWRKNQGYWK